MPESNFANSPHQGLKVLTLWSTKVSWIWSSCYYGWIYRPATTTAFSVGFICPT